jgi:hypothetical protein
VHEFHFTQDKKTKGGEIATFHPQQDPQQDREIFGRRFFYVSVDTVFIFIEQ